MIPDLDEAILINESTVELVAGDVSLFENAHRAAEALEIADVRNGEYFAYRLNGIKLRIEVQAGDIRFTEVPGPASIEIVRSLLVQTAEHVIRARARKANAVELPGHRFDLGELSTLDLVQLVGFSRQKPEDAANFENRR